MQLVITRLKQQIAGEGGIREMLTLALPMIAATASDGIMTFTDRLFLAQLGAGEMNAALGGGVMALTFMFFFMGLTGYSTALVAQYLGSGQKRMCPVTTFQSILIVLASTPLIIALRPLGGWIIQLSHVPAEQAGFQLTYFNILIYGVTISLLRNCLSCYFSGIGRTRVVMIATLGALVVNVVLDYVLIFGKLGFPAMGIAGAAIATLSGGAMAILIFLLAYFSRWNRIEFMVMESFKANWQVIKKLLWYGFPAGTEMLMNFIAFSAMIMIFHAQGLVVGTASTIMFNWDLVTFIPLLGIEIAVTSLTGRYMGAGKPHLAHRSAMSAIITGFLFTTLVMVFFVFFPEMLVHVFRPSHPDATFADAFPLAVGMIRLAAFYVIAEGVMVALVGALRGAGDTHFTMLLSITAHWLFVPVLYLMLNVMKLPPLMGWLALVIVFLFFCVALIWRYRSGKWKTLKVIG